MARKDQATWLYPSSTIWLAPVPLYLYQNLDLTLTLRIEQDPLKVWPFPDMCNAAMRDYIMSEYGYTAAQLIPFLVQFRGLWNKTARDTPDPSFYQHYLGNAPIDPAATGNIASGTALWDKWVGRRAFKVGLVITVGDHEPHVIEMHDPNDLLTRFGGAIVRGAVIEHEGTNVPSISTLPNIPQTQCFAYSRQYGSGESWVHPLDRGRGLHSESYSGPGYTVDVSWDGYGICTVVVNSEGKEIKVGLHAEQEEIRCPQGMGINVNSETEHWGENSLSGAAELMYTSQCTLPHACERSTATWLGADHATEQMHVVSSTNGAPVTTCWTGGSTYSIDSSGDDWTDVGEANRLHFAGILMQGHSYRTDTDTAPPGAVDTFDGTAIGYGYAGLGVRQFSGGAWGGMEPFSTGQQVNVSDDTIYGNYDELIDNYKKQAAAARSRSTTYNTVVSPPRFKISGTFSIEGLVPDPVSIVRVDDGDGGTKPGAIFAEMPYSYTAEAAQLTFSDIRTVEAGAISWTKNLDGDTAEVFDYESEDNFSYAQIGAATLNMEMKLGQDGFSWNWLDSLDDFDGDSTIPEGKLIEDEDSYIYDSRDPQTYQAWLVEQV